jgi:hypothetical protein
MINGGKPKMRREKRKEKDKVASLSQFYNLTF